MFLRVRVSRCLNLVHACLCWYGIMAFRRVNDRDIYVSLITKGDGDTICRYLNSASFGCVMYNVCDINISAWFGDDINFSVNCISIRWQWWWHIKTCWQYIFLFYHASIFLLFTNAGAVLFVLWTDIYYVNMQDRKILQLITRKKSLLFSFFCLCIWPVSKRSWNCQKQRSMWEKWHLTDIWNHFPVYLWYIPVAGPAYLTTYEIWRCF